MAGGRREIKVFALQIIRYDLLRNRIGRSHWIPVTVGDDLFERPAGGDANIRIHRIQSVPVRVHAHRTLIDHHEPGPFAGPDLDR